MQHILTGHWEAEKLSGAKLLHGFMSFSWRDAKN